MKLVSRTHATSASDTRTVAYKSLREWTDIITSPHLISHKKEEEQSSGGRGGCRHTTAGEKHHSPSALLVCDTLADNLLSLSGWRRISALCLSLFSLGGFVVDSGPGAGEFLVSVKLLVSLFNRTVFFSTAGCRTLLVLICP